jgi:hypothetical protein
LDTGIRIAKNSESSVGFPLRYAVVVLPLMGITLVALQPVLTSHRWILSACAAPAKRAHSAIIRIPLSIFIFIVSPFYELGFNRAGSRGAV